MSVFIKGISSQAPRLELHKILSKFGKIVRLKTGYQDFAFVDYESDRSAFAAVKALNGTNLLGSRVTVQIAKKNQHHHHHNNTNERARTLSEDDLLYHRKEELERRPVRTVIEREKGRSDERMVSKRDNNSPMNGEHRIHRFNHFPRPHSYRGRSRPFAYQQSRGTFRLPPRSYNPHRPMPLRGSNVEFRSRSVSRSMSSSKSRSSSPSHSYSFSRSRSSSPSRSLSRSSSRSNSDKSPDRALQVPNLSPQRSRSKEPEERIITRRAQSLEPPALRRWTRVNLTSSATITDDVSDQKEAVGPSKTKEDEVASSQKELAASDAANHNLEAKHVTEDEKHATVLEVERRLKVEEERSAQLEQRLEAERVRVEEERVKRAEEDKLRREETGRLQSENARLQRECERLQRECDKMRDERETARAERDKWRGETERAKSEHETYRKKIEEEMARRVESERQLRVTAERALEEERARGRQSEQSLQTQLTALQAQLQQPVVPASEHQAASVSQESGESDAKEKTNKRKATQQLGTKPKRRKKEGGDNVDLVTSKKKSREREKESVKPSSSAAMPAPSAPSLVLDLTDE